MSEEEGFMLFWACLSIIAGMLASMIMAKLIPRVTFLIIDLKIFEKS